MDDAVLRTLVLVVLAVTAGCASTDAGQTPTPGGTTATPEADAPNPTTMEYPYGTQFVSLMRVNASVAPPPSDPASVRFENLSEARQDTFRRALAEGDLTFRPDDGRANPFSFDDDRPEYVRYEGQWYAVVVGIV